MIRFRPATRTDVPAVIALLVDDDLGKAREQGDMSVYLAAFDAMQSEGGNHLIVGEDGTGRILATYQITFISGLSLRAARRAQIESVRVASDLRGQGVGRQMFADAEARAREAECSLMQLTMNQSRTESNQFYHALGFIPSHTGFKRTLD
ncbi:GNAT family N-acetyltransferase [Roseovarius pelagicus]|uniref:GNAT family N-acetyltransferase n=1 Tax=Roseovarius pelagicus TaxID=2980108 RepID=A0ABY6DG26_9RHOB|nr:GNAT family N-acetyltransferase [Roseovarius pelagicus]UXX84465.1 GNAT family N-acetyltransferase [Roseovarius pelagicus]